MTATKTYVTFKSSAFNATEVREYFINPCCFGDDLAKWLIQEMQKQGIEVDKEPGQEDFGWYISFRCGGERYDFIIGCGEDEGEWTGWLERGVGLLPSMLGGRKRGVKPDVVEAINRILASPIISDLQWHQDEA
jgi:hypothetical protein